MITLMLHIPRDDIESTIGPYQVVVEMRDKAKFGKGKRAWLKEFNEQERTKARDLYYKFYDWYLRRGLPSEWVCTTSTVEFARRLVSFFGGL